MSQSAPTTTRYCPRCGQGTDVEICPDDGSPTFLRALHNTETRMLAVGDVISGRYRIEGILGQGGFGAVFAAEHLMTGQPVAVKVMIGDFGASAEDLVQRFLQEARITASLSHPNTVRIYDFGQTETGVLFMAMEQLRGPTLEAHLHAAGVAGTALSEAETITIGVQVLRSLNEAHGVGLVHRDLKPGNLILVQMAGEPDIVKVLDFGIARPRDSVLTQTGTALGTPTFMSPEQARSEVPDGRSDLYSLGCILFACVAGQPPFVGDSSMSVLLAHQLHALPNLRDVARVPVSEAFVQCIERATAKKVEGRFANAVEMRKALEAIARPAPAPAVPDSEDVWAPTMESDVISDVVSAHTLAGEGLSDLVSSQTLAAEGLDVQLLAPQGSVTALPSGIQLPEDDGEQTVLNDIIEAKQPAQPTPTLRSHPRQPISSAQARTLATPAALQSIGHTTGRRPTAQKRSPSGRPSRRSSSQHRPARGPAPGQRRDGESPTGRGRAKPSSPQRSRALATPQGTGRVVTAGNQTVAIAGRDFGDDPTPVPAAIPSTTRSGSSKPAVVVLASVALVVAVLIGGGAWWALQGGSSTTPSSVVAPPVAAAKTAAPPKPSQKIAPSGATPLAADEPTQHDADASGAPSSVPATQPSHGAADPAPAPIPSAKSPDPIAAAAVVAPPDSAAKRPAGVDPNPTRGGSEPRTEHLPEGAPAIDRPAKMPKATVKKPREPVSKPKKPARKRKKPAKKPTKPASDQAFDLL